MPWIIQIIYLLQNVLLLFSWFSFFQMQNCQSILLEQSPSFVLLKLNHLIALPLAIQFKFLSAAEHLHVTTPHSIGVEINIMRSSYQALPIHIQSPFMINFVIQILRIKFQSDLAELFFLRAKNSFIHSKINSFKHIYSSVEVNCKVKFCLLNFYLISPRNFCKDLLSFPSKFFILLYSSYIKSVII